ncbi:MAG TPA: thiamine-phosphate kinase [Thermoanaerobaculia bacterium]|nr:thiamine-phosphate kinase [Thermoanaerobaculia bacterium]
MNEDEIVARMRTLFSDRIGDDAAVIGDQAVTTDMLVEDVDFTRATPVASIARKSLAVNLSDLAAVGATPEWALSALAIPQWLMPDLDAFLTALAGAAREHRIEIAGGDLSRADKLVVAITAAGRLAHRPLLRSGARAGDRIYLSRPVGGSTAGFRLLQQGWSPGGDPPGPVGYAQKEFARSAIRHHLDPEPETALGIALAALPEVSACIDVSDGLALDLHRLCEASGCGAEIERERIPLFPDLLAAAAPLGIAVRDAVLYGGEEYALLFTSSLRESELSERLRRPVYMIGRTTSGRDVLLREEGKAELLERRGWDHFE